MSGLTCITCQVRFNDADLHRVHFKGDWHRYNLKRKVADLPVVTAEVFESRKESHEKQVKVDNKEIKDPNKYCVACGKNFKNEKAYENHINSKKHQEMILKFETKPESVPKPLEPEPVEADAEDDDDMEVEEVDSDEWEDDPIPVTDCLFCSHHSSTLNKNIVHMTAEHSFFLPDPEFVTNLEGLVEYLGAKVGQGRMCLWCNEKGKRFTAVGDVQRHMVDKGHCKMLHDGESLIEYDDWYDYSTSYPDGEGPPEPDSEVDLQMLDDTGYQMVLPSGAKIGHRSLLRYYRQSLNPERAVVAAHNTQGRQHLLSTYKSLGWTGSSGKAAVIKARDLGYMRRMQNKARLHLGWKANKHMTYFKDRNGMCQ